jgi:hypothetical protein
LKICSAAFFTGGSVFPISTGSGAVVGDGVTVGVSAGEDGSGVGLGITTSVPPAFSEGFCVGLS